MKEAEACTIITYSFNRLDEGWAYKIPDPQRSGVSTASRRPFDMLAAWDDTPYAIEVKFGRGDLPAMSLREEYMPEFQLNNLFSYKDAFPRRECVIGVYMHYHNPAKREHIGFFFDPAVLLELKQRDTPSIKQKTLKHLRDSDFGITILSDGKPQYRQFIQISDLRTRQIKLEHLSYLE